MVDKFEVQMTEPNSFRNGIDLNHQGSSGIHGSSAIGYDSEDYCHPVNLQIDTSEVGKDEFRSSGSPSLKVVADHIEIFKRERSPGLSDKASNNSTDPLFHSPDPLRKAGKRLSITHSKIEGQIKEVKEEKSSCSSSIEDDSPVKD